jgi:hypothetical protein
VVKISARTVEVLLSNSVKIVWDQYKIIVFLLLLFNVSRYLKKGKYQYGILIDSESLKTGLQNGTIFDLIRGELCKNDRADFYLIAKKIG